MQARFEANGTVDYFGFETTIEVPEPTAQPMSAKEWEQKERESITRQHVKAAVKSGANVSPALIARYGIEVTQAIDVPSNYL